MKLALSIPATRLGVNIPYLCFREVTRRFFRGATRQCFPATRVAFMSASHIRLNSLLSLCADPCIDVIFVRCSAVLQLNFSAASETSVWLRPSFPEPRQEYVNTSIRECVQILRRHADCWFFKSVRYMAARTETPEAQKLSPFFFPVSVLLDILTNSFRKMAGGSRILFSCILVHSLKECPFFY